MNPVSENGNGDFRSYSTYRRGWLDHSGRSRAQLGSCPADFETGFWTSCHECILAGDDSANGKLNEKIPRMEGQRIDANQDFTRLTSKSLASVGLTIHFLALKKKSLMNL